MSADEILAANLWPWPDPLLKRDRNGQVLFVNAAFLHLYGGRIEDWRGNMITGWPAPATQGAQRFETRAGDPPQTNVYDWVEMMMADGNAMAIARNVTALVPAPTPPASVAIPPIQPPVQALTAPPVSAEIVETAPTVQAPAATPTPSPAAPQIAPPAPPAPAPAPEPVPVQAAPIDKATETAPDLSSDFEETLNRSADDYLEETAAPEAQAAVPSAEAAPVASATPQQAEPEPENTRMFERRALPIEDSTAVLGTNWRDQVIAKAIGADTAEKEEEEEVVEPDEPEEQQQTAVEGGKMGAGLKILLAEDNAINALLTRTLLEAEGAIVETVEDGALAVEAVKKDKYDLIFMDMRMPNMDGLEATRKIRALGGDNATMPIVALTANAFDDDRNACFDSGMNDFMTKPVSAEELEEMVANWTKKQDAEKLAS